MQLEGVGTVAMGGILLQVAGKVDNVDGFKGTFLPHCNVRVIAHDNLMEQTLVHMPHPIHNVSEMVATLSVGVTSIHSFPARHNVASMEQPLPPKGICSPIRTTGHDFLHS